MRYMLMHKHDKHTEAGLPPPRLTLPYPIAMAAALAVERAYKLLRIDKTPPISPFVVKILSRHVIYDASKAARGLGFRPKMSALEGIALYARRAAERGEGRS